MVAVDRLDVVVLVDNVTDSLSSNPPSVLSEWTGLLTGGRMRMVSGRATCCAHFGLSFLITAHIGESRHTVLFDAGPEGDTFLRNAAVLGVDLSAVDAVVLSHGHWDHAGGLAAAVEAIWNARALNRIDCFLHPEAFTERGMLRPNGEVLRFEPLPHPRALAEVGANLVEQREPQSIAGDAFWLSGEIPRVTPYESGFPGHVRRRANGWEPDPLVIDERFVSVHVKDKGQVVFSACSHAGLINVLAHARSAFPAVPLYGVMGGLHLAGANEKIIPQTLGDLRTFGLRLLAPGHCTGWRALGAMSAVFGEELAPLAVGKRYLI
jgi:7,8-dihydropterin-6-yl-methyl-4-(beta-D-ribofuranosyl)aminobenzene 5'-phosphate synthase